MKILAVGDLHTKTWIIDEVAKLVNNYDAIVFVGDYADNWNTIPTESITTWRILKNFSDKHKGKVHALIGNHDFAYIHHEIAGRSSGWSNITYTILNAPENRDIRDWLLSLPIVFELDGTTFSHAGVTEEWDGGYDVYSLWNDVSPIWARPREYGGHVTYKNIPQVIGHNPSEKIWNPQDGIWCIDVFSEHRDNTPVGDHTVLEIINNKQFNIIKLKNANNNNTPSVEDSVSR